MFVSQWKNHTLQSFITLPWHILLLTLGCHSPSAEHCVEENWQDLLCRRDGRCSLPGAGTRYEIGASQHALPSLAYVVLSCHCHTGSDYLVCVLIKWHCEVFPEKKPALPLCSCYLHACSAWSQRFSYFEQYVTGELLNSTPVGLLHIKIQQKNRVIYQEWFAINKWLMCEFRIITYVHKRWMLHHSTCYPMYTAQISDLCGQETHVQGHSCNIHGPYVLFQIYYVMLYRYLAGHQLGRLEETPWKDLSKLIYLF